MSSWWAKPELHSNRDSFKLEAANQLPQMQKNTKFGTSTGGVNTITTQDEGGVLRRPVRD